MTGPASSVRPTPIDLEGVGSRGGARSNRWARETLELTAPGRSPVDLLFVAIGERWYAVPGDPPGEWFTAAAREGRVIVRRSQGSPTLAAARVRSQPELLREVRDRFDEKYGTDLWPRYFESASGVLEMDPFARPTEASALGRIRGEFDAVAGSYDAAVARNPFERNLKDRAATLAVDAFTGLDRLLEIGPGTGYHTLRLLTAGHPVVAVDVSPGMLEVLRRRASVGGLAEMLEMRLGSTRDLPDVVADLPTGSFEGAFSGFGALELESDPRAAVSAVARLVRPGGVWVFTTINRPGWAAMAWELAAARPRAAAARLRRTIPRDEVGYNLEIYPRSPTDWDRWVAPAFERVSAVALSTLAPPYSTDRGLRFLGVEGMDRLRRWDRRVSDLPISRSAAEWLLLTYRRTDAPSARGGGSGTTPGAPL